MDSKYSSETVAYKDFVSDDSGFFFDYNEGRKVFSVEVSGDFSELVFSDSRPGSRVIDPWSLSSTEELYHVVTFLEGLWSRPYIVAKVFPDKAIFLNRGLEFRAWWVRKRFDIIMSRCGSWFKVKGKKSRHIVVTVTVPHNVPISEAYRLIRKRVREVIQFFRRYGLRGYVGVLEVHKDGYPHYHLVLFVKKKLLVFDHKGIWRFVDKRSWDRSLSSTSKGFIDCMALKGGARGARAYFSKYLKKSYTQSQEEEDNEINLKPYTLIVARLFKIRPLIYSRNFSKFIPRVRKRSKLKRELVEVGKLLSLKKTNLSEIATVQREIRKRLDYISRFCSHESGSEEKIVLEFLRRGDLDKVFHYARYLYENSFSTVSLAWVSISVS